MGLSGTRAKDRSGNNNHGTLTNGPVLIAGKVGQALSFDGVDDVVDTPFILDDYTAFTVSAWVRADEFNQNFETIWSANDASGCGGEGLFSGVNNNFTYRVRGTSSTVTMPGLSRKWVHFVATYDASNKILYVNGVPRIAGASGAAAKGNTPFEIGRFNDCIAGDEFDGLIDDVRIYNRALSAGEIQKLYNQGR